MAKREISWAIVPAVCCVVALVAMVLMVSWSAWHSYRSPSWEDVEGADLAKFGPLLREQAKQNNDGAMRALLIAEIHAADADERAVLDRLVTVVGGYSLLLGLAAFATVRLTAEQARGQLKTVDQEMERLSAAMSSELLELRNLKDGLRTLLFELERTIPEETDWNARESYEKLTPSQIQNILINETTIAALPIFLSNQSTENREVMARLYRALANFYLGRFQKQRMQEDGERAHIYARKSLDMMNDSPDAYRLRGSIFLSQYWILRSKPGAASDASTAITLEQLLSEAESYLRLTQAKKKGDAGAVCNLALVAAYREQIEEGLRILEEGIRNRDEFSDIELRKYLPAMYINLSCLKARQADIAEDRSESHLAATNRDESLSNLEVGITYLEERRVFTGIDKMRREIDRELKPESGDFRRMGPERILRLRELLRAGSERTPSQL